MGQTVMYCTHADSLHAPPETWTSHWAYQQLPVTCDYEVLKPQRTLETLLLSEAQGLPRQYMVGWLLADPRMITRTANNSRRRLTSEPVGYGSHDHASTRRHIHRLLTSE